MPTSQTFNHWEFHEMPENRILKIKLSDRADLIYVNRVWQHVLQAYQPGFTPITKIELQVITDLDAFMEQKEDYRNFKQLSVEPKEVEYFEVLDI